MSLVQNAPADIKTYYAPQTDMMTTTETKIVNKADFNADEDGQVLERENMGGSRSRDCDSTGNSFHVLSSHLKKCDYINPFLNCPGCFSADQSKEGLMVSTDAVGPYDFNLVSPLHDKVLKHTGIMPYSPAFSTLISTMCSKLKPLKPSKRQWAITHMPSNAIKGLEFKKRWGPKASDCLGWQHKIGRAHV